MQIIHYTYGGEAHLEVHKILPMVSSDIDVSVIHGDEGSHEETSEGVLTIPGQNWTGSFQEALVNPS